MTSAPGGAPGPARPRPARRRRSRPTSSCSTRRRSRSPATYDEPRRFPEGIPYVIVNGTVGRRRRASTPARRRVARSAGDGAVSRPLDTARRQNSTLRRHPRRRPPLTIETPARPRCRRRPPRAAPSRSRRAARDPPSSPAGAVHRRPGVSRAPGTAPRSARPTPTPAARDRARPGLRLGSRRGRDGGRHPGHERRGEHRRRTSRSSSPSAARSATRPSRSRCSPPPDRETLREAKRRRHAPDGGARRPSSTRSSPTIGVRPLRARPRRRRGGARRARTSSSRATYRVGHQEQLYIENNAMIALPREDGGITVHGSLQCPYYVHKALHRGPRPRRRARPGRPGGDGRRLRRQGGVPVDDRAPRRAARAARRASRCA